MRCAYRLFLNFALSILLLIAFSSSGRCQDTEVIYHSYYFKTPQPLTLDLSKISVMDRSTTEQEERPVLSASLRETLRRHNIADELTVPQLRNYSLAAVPEGKRGNARAVKDLLQAIRSECPTVFVTPVFVNKDGHGPLIITDLVFLSFSDKSTPEQRRAIVSGLNVVGVDDKGGVVGFWHALTFHTQDGFEVLADVNRLSEDPLVVYAEPNVIARALPL